MQKYEPLDYCRVKKIKEKGFGFLSSLHYEKDVFFHFNMVKDPETKEKLEKMQRGDVYFYFTSVEKQGKRRVDKLWLDLADVDRKLIPEFVQRIIGEFKLGERHPFEVAYVIRQLRYNEFLREKDIREILASPKLSRNPSIVKGIFKENETDKLGEVEDLIQRLESNQVRKNEWMKRIFALLQE